MSVLDWIGVVLFLVEVVFGVLVTVLVPAVFAFAVCYVAGGERFLRFAKTEWKRLGVEEKEK